MPLEPSVKDPVVGRANEKDVVLPDKKLIPSQVAVSLLAKAAVLDVGVELVSNCATVEEFGTPEFQFDPFVASELTAPVQIVVWEWSRVGAKTTAKQSATNDRILGVQNAVFIIGISQQVAEAG